MKKLFSSIICKVLDFIYQKKTDKICISNKYDLDTKINILMNYRHDLQHYKNKFGGGSGVDFQLD